MVKNNYRISYLKSGPYGSDTIATKDIYAKDSDAAMKIAHAYADAGDYRLYGADEISVEEIPEEPCNIGIEYLYTDTIFKKDFHDYVIIFAKDEEQAKEYYNDHLKGTRFWFNSSEIDPSGKCVRGKIISTYFAACPGYDFNAMAETA